jgi:hypothetical protein
METPPLSVLRTAALQAVETDRTHDVIMGTTKEPDRYPENLKLGSDAAPKGTKGVAQAGFEADAIQVAGHGPKHLHNQLPICQLQRSVRLLPVSSRSVLGAVIIRKLPPGTTERVNIAGKPCVVCDP